MLSCRRWGKHPAGGTSNGALFKHVDEARSQQRRLVGPMLSSFESLILRLLLLYMHNGQWTLFHLRSTSPGPMQATEGIQNKSCAQPI